jgi:hypothetical protein
MGTSRTKKLSHSEHKRFNYSGDTALDTTLHTNVRPVSAFHRSAKIAVHGAATALKFFRFFPLFCSQKMNSAYPDAFKTCLPKVAL